MHSMAQAKLCVRLNDDGSVDNTFNTGALGGCRSSGRPVGWKNGGGRPRPIHSSEP